MLGLVWIALGLWMFFAWLPAHQPMDAAQQLLYVAEKVRRLEDPSLHWMFNATVYPVMNVVAITLAAAGLAEAIAGVLYRPRKEVVCRRCKTSVLARKVRGSLRCPNGGHLAVVSYTRVLLVILVVLLVALTVLAAVAGERQMTSDVPGGTFTIGQSSSQSAASPTPTEAPSSVASVAVASSHETRLQVTKIGRGAKRLFAERGALATGNTGLTPATACCQGPGQRCPAQPELWPANPIWMALDFQIDEPARAQYSYESDGTTLTIRAVEDPECDGHVVTVEALGQIVNGELEITQRERVGEAR